MERKKGLLTMDTKVIEDLEREGLMKDVHDDIGRVTQKAKMLSIISHFMLRTHTPMGVRQKLG